MDKRHLHILWTTGEALTAEHMVLMYAANAKRNGWWDEVTVIVWGAAVRLLSEDEQVRFRVRESQEAGVKFTACRTCAERMGFVEDLRRMGVETILWGPPLTELLREHAPLLTV